MQHKSRQSLKPMRTFIGYAERYAYLYKLNFENYNNYLRSEIWAEVRKQVLKRDNYECFLCEMRATQVHHLRYDLDTLTGKSLDRMISICTKCHKFVEFDSQGEKFDLKDMQLVFKRARHLMDKGMDIKESFTTARKKIAVARNRVRKADETLDKVESLTRDVRQCESLIELDRIHKTGRRMLKCVVVEGGSKEQKRLKQIRTKFYIQMDRRREFLTKCLSC